MSDKTLTAELLKRLQRHYIKPGELMPGGIFLPEVTLDGRRADALYVGFFASRGKFLVGHELKVSRADWLHELAQPEKAETWFRECHSWYLVAIHESIVLEGELPPGWGLMVPGPSKTRMRVLVQAEQRPITSPSWAATHAIVQRVDSLRMDAIVAAREKARLDADAEIEKRLEARLSYHDNTMAERRAEHLQKLVDRVGEILGFNISDDARDWDPEYISPEFLDGSFRRWLAADKDLLTHLNYRVRALKGVREQIEGAESALAVLLDEVGVVA